MWRLSKYIFDTDSLTQLYWQIYAYAMLKLEYSFQLRGS